MVVTTHADYEQEKRLEEWTDILNIIYYTDLGYAFLFREYWSNALVKSSE